MSKIRRNYTKEQKLEIVKLSLEAIESIKELSSRFDVSKSTIYKWRSLYFQYENNAFPGHGHKAMTDEQAQINALKKQLREAQLERDILKKAVRIFSKSDSKFSNL